MALLTYLKEIYTIWINEKPNQLAAALAYYGMFSFSAIIYLAYRLAGIFINELAAGQRLSMRLEAVLGAETVAFIQQSVASLSADNAGGSWIISLISFGTLVFAAMGLFLQLSYVLNRIWGLPLIRREPGLARLRQRLFAFIMLIALGLLVILATVVNMAYAWFGALIQEVLGSSELITFFNFLTLAGLVVLANAFVYKYLPDIKLSWRDVWPGAITATVLMILGGLAMGLYFKLGGIRSAFSAAGAFAVLMVTIYYFAQIFLVGAIITRIYARRHGTLSRPV